MLLLAVDPGASTGIAFYAQRPLEIPALRTNTLSPLRLRSWLARKHQWHADDYTVLVERIPEGGMRETVLIEALILEQLEPLAKALHRPSPGEWKPFVKANRIPYEWYAQCHSDHEQDAAGMLWWWLQTHKETV